MDKIITVALKAQFPGINIDAVLDVINATSNPVIATETLLGIYEEPIIANQSMVERNAVCTFTFFDKYRQRVSYKYSCTRTRTNYFLTQEELDACTEYNENLPTYNPNGDKYPFSKSFEVIKEETSYTDLNHWQSKAIVSDNEL